MKQKGRHRIERPSELELLVSPVRMELLEAIEALGPCTVAELAEAVGRRPSSLYFHLGRLVEAGLVLEDAEGEAARYRTVARTMQLVQRPGDRRQAPVLARSAAAILRAAERAVRRAFETRRARVRGPGRNTILLAKRGWLSAEDAREVAGHVDAIVETFERSRRSREGQLVGFTVCMAPLEPKGESRA